MLVVLYDLMIWYEGVYADIIFNQGLFLLLKFILEDDQVNDKILFGTNYYIVVQKALKKNIISKFT